MELRPAAVCRDCLSLLRQPRNARRIARPLIQQFHSLTAPAYQTNPSSSRARRSIPRQTSRRLAVDSQRLTADSQTQRRGLASEPRGQSAPARSLDLNALLRRVNDLSASAIKIEDGSLPSEQRLLYVFEQLSSIARSILDERLPETANAHREQKQKSSSAGSKQQETATSALLGSVNATQYPAFISKTSILVLISQKAEEIVRHPDVFITPAILKLYVQLQSLLSQPSSFPDVFDLYARKPAPKLKSTHEVEYTPVSPDKINAAIDSSTANAALTASIDVHDLPLAIDIITTSFCTPAFKKAKILRQAAFPMAGLFVAPAAAYTLATSFSSLQQTMDPAMATQVAFAGIMTYAGAVGMVGYVAVTTANDQMDRITWASGVPLWERWIREEERAAVDRVAGAWGFRNVAKRGEEEGEEWEALREWVGVRGMMLDRVSLMEGME
ncbi:hypothetical protein DOTSEDRAFT_68625 [Lecanosticta acicola]|uniref:Uncharacterized protein n=1 Tax=Lecanosticta acicola TaxID=111012 RepID=A0AAI9EF67_9PEZI|nr:hypothetical protein DOTSEDRAFT_68625 [Lecanosticta acicola]